jgi:hypothetical protein
MRTISINNIEDQNAIETGIDENGYYEQEERRDNSSFSIKSDCSYDDY